MTRSTVTVPAGGENHNLYTRMTAIDLTSRRHAVHFGRHDQSVTTEESGASSHYRW